MSKGLRVGFRWAGAVVFCLAGIGLAVPGAAQSVWNLRSTGVAADLFGVTWSGNMFVAVGAGGTVVTSPDGITWTNRATATTNPLKDVVWMGTRYVAVGWGPGPVLTSANGTDWGVVAGTGTANLNAVAWSGSRLVAVGTSSLTATSTDGLTWTSRNLSPAVNLTDVVWSGSMFVAVGTAGTVFTSPDGLAWTRRNSATNLNLYTVSSSGGRLVASGAAGTTVTSTDGITWAYRYDGTGLDLTASVWADTQFVNVGWNASVGWGAFASRDGATWTRTYLTGLRAVTGLAWSGTRLVVVGNGGFAMTSTPRYAYLRSAAGAPWAGSVPPSDPGSNESAMDRAFGAHNWDDLRYEFSDATEVFAPGREVVFMEGSDDNQNELQAFLLVMATPLQQWVAGGGRLFLNAAPTEGTGVVCGFGVNLSYQPSTTVLPTAQALMPGHPVFQSPVATGASFEGADFSRATVNGTGLTHLLAGTGSDSGKIILAEMDQGLGKVVFGGMTLPKFHTTQPAGNNLRSNILSYLRPPLVASPEITVEQPAGTAIVDGGSKSFGSVLTGSNTSLSFTIRNTGRAPLTGVAVTKDGPHSLDFVVTVNPAATVAGLTGRTVFTVRFTPLAAGPRTATLRIASNDADENPYEITVTGEGVPAIPNIVIEEPKNFPVAPGDTVDFGAVAPKKKPKLTFGLRNTGTGALSGLIVTISGPNAAEFKLTGNFTNPVKPGQVKTFKVQLIPTSTGPKNAVLQVISNDPDAAENPYLVNLTGNSVTATAVSGPVAAAMIAGAGAEGALATAPGPDSDGDGMSDVLERATGGDPGVASAAPWRVEHAGGRLALVYPRLAAAVSGGTEFAVEWSDDLRVWSTSGVEEKVLSESGGVQQVRAEAALGNGRRFLRLRVTAPH